MYNTDKFIDNLKVGPFFLDLCLIALFLNVELKCNFCDFLLVIFIYNHTDIIFFQVEFRIGSTFRAEIRPEL